MAVSKQHSEEFSLPRDTRVFTVYGCALGWDTPTGFRFHAWMISVSGERPLTQEEAVARARQEVAAWPEHADYTFHSGSASSSVIKPDVR